MFVSVFRLRKKRIMAIGALALCAVFGLWLFSRPRAATLADVPIDEPKRIVYLTFDDGPSKVTGELLDLLKEEDVQATFFVIGATTDRGKMLYQRMVDEGHAIGIHSFSHRYQEIYESSEAYLRDFDKLGDHLEAIVGVRPDIFRFPGGSNNATASPKVLNEIKEETAKRGAVYFDWNAIAKDDKSYPTEAGTMVQNVLKSAGDSERVLILMHDDSIRTTLVDCVRELIHHYRAEGYAFEVLTSKTPPIQFS